MTLSPTRRSLFGLLAIGLGSLISAQALAFTIGSRTYDDSSTADAFSNFTFTGGGQMSFGNDLNLAYSKLGGDDLARGGRLSQSRQCL